MVHEQGAEGAGLESRTDHRLNRPGRLTVNKAVGSAALWPHAAGPLDQKHEGSSSMEDTPSKARAHLTGNTPVRSP